MIDTEEVKDGGMQVIDADPVFHRLVTELVTGPVVGTSLDSSPVTLHGPLTRL